MTDRTQRAEATPTLKPDPFGNQEWLPIIAAQDLVRVAGGSETDVYRGENAFVLKLKPHTLATWQEALGQARELRAAAERFVAYLGPQHTVASAYLIAQSGTGRLQVLVVQPHIDGRPLADANLWALDRTERIHIALQLGELVRRALICYRESGHLPDLHGNFSANSSERDHLNRPGLWPWRIWHFFIGQSVLSAHNLLLTNGPERRVVLVDYDEVRWKGLLGRLFYLVRWMLFWRDHMVIMQLRHLP